MTFLAAALAFARANPWRLAALILMAAIAIQALRLDGARGRLAAEQARHQATSADLAQARANRKALEAALAEQLAAVDALARKGEAARAEAAKAENRAAEQRKAATALRGRLEADLRQSAGNTPVALTPVQEEAWNALAR